MNNNYKYTWYSGAVKIIANLLTLVMVAVAVYHSSKNPDESFVVFCRWFFGLAIPVWWAAWRIHKYLRVRYPLLRGDDVSEIVIPGKGPQRVRWVVVEEPR